MWETFLADHNIVRIKTVGEIFNPHVHEALEKVIQKEKKDQEIIEEKLAGFTLDDSIIRPAKVIINNLEK